jgi:FkbM family methyltransferase
MKNMKNTLSKFVDFKNKKIYDNKVPPSLEQECVRAFFSNAKDGIFVDVGANDPFIESQSYHLEQLGWHGLLIEPLPNMCELLRKNRTGIVVPYACSSKENHKKILPLISFGVCSTLESKLIHTNKVKQDVIYIETRTLDSILEENNIKESFDLLSIDVEGHEIELFKGFDIQRWKPKLVLLEDHVTTQDKHKFMVKNGYQFLLRTGLNTWYVNDASSYSVSLKSKFEFIRKYWLGILFRKFRIK